MKLMKSPQVMMLVSIVLIKHHQITCLLLNLFPPKQLKWMIGEKNATFHTFIKIGNKSCKVIVDSESCINVISFKSLEMLGLEVVPHPHPFKVSWIDSKTLEVKQQYLVPVYFKFSIIKKTRSGAM